MNPSHREGWPPSSSGPGYSNMSRTSEPSRAPGQPGSFGSSTPSHQSSQPSGPVLPPPPGPFHPAASGPSGPSFPSMPGMAQHSPTHQHRSSLPQHEPQQNLPPHSGSQQGYSLPSINQAAPGHHMTPQQAHERDRELHEAREREARDREYEQSRRERENREREMREQHTPHQSHSDSVQLHQPVAIGPQMRSAIHGPNGLLNNPVPGGQSQAQNQPPPNAPPSLFNPQYEGTPRMNVQQSPSQGPVVPFGGTPTMHPAAGPALGPGQQPILNDALSYLDQVKVQFSGEPNVYNQFLDIMKDFKSQAIDTPGVIRRVSSLFAGNPNLIQGFNTFLPPGYRIECGSDGDPNAIRVTTPMGHTVSPMGSSLRPLSRPRSVVNEGNNQLPLYDQPGRSGDGRWTHHPEHGEGSFSPRNQPHPGYGPLPGHQARMSPFDNSARDPGAIMHQQEARGVSQLQSAASAATGEGGRPPVGGVPSPTKSSTPLPGGANGMAGQQAGPLGGEKRGPVEFNHAISYVNKIKNRFASQPEIYKQFLEILQTYQRESKPIQDVYSQVTHLFDGAPDLLEDFKQFLPESAAHAKAVAARQAAEDMTMLSSMRGDGYSQQPPRARTPRPEQHRLPPVGNFAPTPSARDSKRKRDNRDRPGQPGLAGVNASGPGNDFGPAGAGARNGFGPNKRAKPSQVPPQAKAVAQVEGPPISPTLVPALPEPMPPSTSSMATNDEIQFFDRVKKLLANKISMNDVLKTCNLYSQDLIDKNTLVFRVGGYISHNKDLFDYFKNWVGYDGKDQIIENRAKPPSGRVSLNNCRAYGPSYRLLPKRERLKPCSGRDELCNSVLNDEWASHPTWASEDSGFIAHRKNTFEEALHRIEEERFDYDLNIAKIERTIQILEPLAQQNRRMSEEDRAQWHLPADFGGQTQPIVKSVISKVYSREESVRIIRGLIDHPAQVLPVLLMRFRMKAEEWKAAQREWDKVWREQTQKMFWRSLDHQAVAQKQSDKRQFQTKTLQNEIQVKYEEQKRLALMTHTPTPKYQAEYTFSDVAVLMDASHLVLTYAEHHHSTEFPALTSFIKDFIPLFFGIDMEAFQQRIKDVFESPSPHDDVDEEAIASDDSNHPRGRKVNGKKSDLLQKVLGKGRKPGQTEESVASGSRATTPDVTSVVDEEMRDVEPLVEESRPKNWMNHPIDGNVMRQKEIKPNEPYKRSNYNLYANLPIYCFFRMFVILYERLHSLKINEKEVHEAVRRAKQPKAAVDLKMSEKHPDSYFSDTSANANYYHQMLNMFEESAKTEQNFDQMHIEEILRRFYLQSGWLLYHLEKMLSALTRFGIAVMSNDGKERSSEIITLFQKDRKKEMTTHQDELNYRRQVEKHNREGDTYRITFNPTTMVATTRILKRDETTFDTAATSPNTANAEEDGMYTPEQRWAYYISSYSTSLPTEGIPGPIPRPFEKRDFRITAKRLAPNAAVANAATAAALNPHSDAADNNAWNELYEARAATLREHETLELRVSPQDYKIYYAAQDSDEWWIAGDGANSKAKAMSAQNSTAADTAATDPTGDAGETAAVGGTGDDGQDAENAGDEAAEATKTGDQDKPMDDVDAADGAPGNADGEEEAHRTDPTGEFEEKFVMNSPWMAGLSRDEVDTKNAEFRSWKANGTEGASEASAAAA